MYWRTGTVPQISRSMLNGSDRVVSCWNIYSIDRPPMLKHAKQYEKAWLHIASRPWLAAVAACSIIINHRYSCRSNETVYCIPVYQCTQSFRSISNNSNQTEPKHSSLSNVQIDVLPNGHWNETTNLTWLFSHCESNVIPIRLTFAHQIYQLWGLIRPTL